MNTELALTSKVLRNSAYILMIALLILGAVIAASVPHLREARADSRIRFASIGGCQMFPANNIWNYDISHLPVSQNSANYIASISLKGPLHPDFGAGFYNGGPIGFPYVVVPGSQPYVPVSFDYASESDPGPYPIPPNAPIENGPRSTGDRHVLVLDSSTCKLYEMYSSYPQPGGSWHAVGGAVWYLESNALRPINWTSADAAGLPILPGLVTYDEVASGVINHALRFTVNQTQRAFLWPARHEASSNSNPNLPPMGLRLRLKASVDISSFSHTNQVILTALKHYGMFVADNGDSWLLSGAPDNRWNNDDLHQLTTIPGSDFEAIDESTLQMDANSAQVANAPLAPTSTPTAVISLTHSPTTTITTIGTRTPQEARPTEIAKGRHNASHSVSTTSSTSPLVLIGGAVVVFLLGMLGIAFIQIRRKRSKPSL